MNLEKTNITQAKELVQQAWWAGIQAVNGYDLVLAELANREYSNVTHVLAIGKAASAMMLAAYDTLGVFKGLSITKYGHGDKRLKQISTIELIESSHPVPDENSLIAGQRAVDFINSMNHQDRLLVLVSGGASALAELLPDTITLTDLQQLNQKMLAQQQTIHQINQARSEISLIKYGKLLNQCKAGSIATLAISDVQGDDIKVIGSGIGACDLQHYKSKIIGSNEIARNAVADFFVDNDINVILNQESLYDDVYHLAEHIATVVNQGELGVYIYGGEPTIELPENPGRGGRNQALALALARQINSEPAVVALVAGSDGSDGPTDAAGGLVDAQTFATTELASQALKHADAGTYLDSVGALFITGPTGTNVMDLAIIMKLEQ